MKCIPDMLRHISQVAILAGMAALLFSCCHPRPSSTANPDLEITPDSNAMDLTSEQPQQAFSLPEWRDASNPRSLLLEIAELGAKDSNGIVFRVEALVPGQAVPVSLSSFSTFPAGAGGRFRIPLDDLVKVPGWREAKISLRMESIHGSLAPALRVRVAGMQLE